MLELYFNDGNFLPESREEEQSAETVLNIMLAGKTTDTEMCIWPCFYHAPMFKPSSQLQMVQQPGNLHLDET